MYRQLKYQVKTTEGMSECSSHDNGVLQVKVCRQSFLLRINDYYIKYYYIKLLLVVANLRNKQFFGKYLCVHSFDWSTRYLSNAAY